MYCPLEQGVQEHTDTEHSSPASTVIWRLSLCVHNLSMSLYFFLRMETWSLNNTGSNLIWECTKGMKPSQWLKAFMQLCRWAKWSGSAQRDDTLEPFMWENRERVGEEDCIRVNGRRDESPQLYSRQ